MKFVYGKDIVIITKNRPGGPQVQLAPITSAGDTFPVWIAVSGPSEIALAPVACGPCGPCGCGFVLSLLCLRQLTAAPRRDFRPCLPCTSPTYQTPWLSARAFWKGLVVPHCGWPPGRLHFRKGQIRQQ